MFPEYINFFLCVICMVSEKHKNQSLTYLILMIVQLLRNAQLVRLRDRFAGMVMLPERPYLRRPIEAAEFQRDDYDGPPERHCIVHEYLPVLSQSMRYRPKDQHQIL